MTEKPTGGNLPTVLGSVIGWSIHHDGPHFGCAVLEQDPDGSFNGEHVWFLAGFDEPLTPHDLLTRLNGTPFQILTPVSDNTEAQPLHYEHPTERKQRNLGLAGTIGLPTPDRHDLRSDIDPEVRAAIAARHDLTETDALALAADPSAQVRHAIAQNTTVREEVRIMAVLFPQDH